MTITGAGLDSVTGVKMVKEAWTEPVTGDDAAGETYPEDSIAVRFKRIDASTIQITTPAWGWGPSKVVLTNGTTSASGDYSYKLDAGNGNSVWEKAVLDAINAKRATGVTCGNGTVMPAVAPIATLKSSTSDHARVFTRDLVARNSEYVKLNKAHARFGALASGQAQSSANSTSVSAGYGSEVVAYSIELGNVSATKFGLNVVDNWIKDEGPANVNDPHCRAIMSPTAKSISIGVGILDTGNAMVAAGISAGA